MGNAIPKQFLTLRGKPILLHTLEKLHAFDASLRLIVVLPAADLPRWHELVALHQCPIPHQITAGGATRFHSVSCGLALISDDAHLIAIHDGVRPLVSLQVMERAFALAAQQGSAVAAVKLKESIRRGDEQHSQAVDRAAFRLVQTPQVFRAAWIKKAYATAVGTDFTDCASVAESAGHPIYLSEGAYENIKITTPEDLLLAEALLQA